MVRIAKPGVKESAKAGMQAFGKGKQKIKGPANGKVAKRKEPDADEGAPPGSFVPHAEPDMDDMMKFKMGSGQSKGRSKGSSSRAKKGLY